MITFGGRHDHHYHTWLDEKTILCKLDLITEKLDLIMGKQERILTAIAELDAATNEVASDLQALRDQLAQEGVSTESLDELDAKIARLKVLGQDPENPVPPVEEPPVEPTPTPEG